MLEQQEYQSEGIDITSINFKDNKPILVVTVILEMLYDNDHLCVLGILLG